MAYFLTQVKVKKGIAALSEYLRYLLDLTRVFETGMNFILESFSIYWNATTSRTFPNDFKLFFCLFWI